jgi:hypothetical protein
LVRCALVETDPLDLVGPPERRCGNFFLVKMVGRGFEATMELGRPMMMSASPGGAAPMVAPATAGRGEVGGLRQSIDKFRGTNTARSPSLAQRAALTDQRKSGSPYLIHSDFPRARLTRSIWSGRLSGAAGISF